MTAHISINPPEQKVPGGHGEHGVPAAASPLYPGLHTHWVRELLPSGEVEFSGHDSGEEVMFWISVSTATYPWIEKPEVSIELDSVSVSLVGTTNDSASVFNVEDCCSN